MANVGSVAWQLSFIIKNVAPVRFANALPARSYSLYPKNYIKPTFNKEKQEALKESGEDLRLAHIPILPALNSNTSSVFHDEAVEKFTNYIMREGKKATARRVLDGAFETIKRVQLARYHKATAENVDDIMLDPVTIFHQAVVNATPIMELVKMKRGGITYQVPVPILEKRQRFLAMNWLIQSAKDKPMTTPFTQSLAMEIIDAAYNKGRTVKRKQDLHKNCEANRAYAHYRWT